MDLAHRQSVNKSLTTSQVSFSLLSAQSPSHNHPLTITLSQSPSHSHPLTIILCTMAAPDLLVFNQAVNGMITEANNMSTTVQNYAQHQQTMVQQLQLIGNQPFGPILQNLSDAVQTLTGQIARLEALPGQIARLEAK